MDNTKGCGNCFFLSLKGVSSLAPCYDCKFNKENFNEFAKQSYAWTKDCWVTDSDDFWKDTQKEKMTESYQKDALRSENLKTVEWPFPPGEANQQTSKENPLDVQVGGGHYKTLEIQPVEYIHANKIPFIEGNIIKYITRWREKGGKADLQKVKHFVDLLIELEFKE
jgi:hypothetical protein